MLEYFHSPELTQSAFDGEYFKTGDYGRIENEELYITGRIKESIHLSNGEKVSPEDIENSYKETVGQEIEFAVTGMTKFMSLLLESRDNLMKYSNRSNKLSMLIIGIKKSFMLTSCQKRQWEKLNDIN